MDFRESVVTSPASGGGGGFVDAVGLCTGNRI